MATASGRSLPDDQITDDLRIINADIAARLGELAVVTGDRTEGAGIVEGCTVEPAGDGAVSVWWIHSGDDITAGFGNAPGWALPRTSEGVETLRAIVDAAIRGAVEVGTGRGVTVYRVRTPGGVVREDTHGGLKALVMSLPWKPRLRWTTAKAYA